MSKVKINKFPFISVVIPAFNEECFIIKTLKSLKRQDYEGDYEIIVVDNNSTDKTAEIAKKLGAKVIFESKKGVQFAREAGFRKALGEIIATTDADSILPKNWLSRIAFEFEKRKDAVAVSGLYSFYDSNFSISFLTNVFIFPLFPIFSWYSGANLAIKKQAFFKVGGFDLRLSLSEDTDICRRLKRVGKVYRLNYLKVKTSARRFNKLGFFGAIFNYANTYSRIKLMSTDEVKFKSGSEISEKAKPVLRIRFIYTSFLILSLIAFLALIISPVRAKIISNKEKLERKIAIEINHTKNILLKIKNYPKNNLLK